MKYMIYAWRIGKMTQDVSERENSMVTVDNTSLAMKIAVTATEWMSEGEFGVVAVMHGEDVVTTIIELEGQYSIDGDTYVNWRDVDDEIYYRIGEYASEKEMEQ